MNRRLQSLIGRRTSLKWKLSLVFFGVVAIAFATLYFVLLPQLESNLEEQKLSELSRTAQASSSTLEDVMGRDIPATELDRLVRTVADGAGAQVTLLGVQRSVRPGSGEPSFFAISDSRAGGEVQPAAELARRAISSREIQTNVTQVGGEQVGNAAQPLYFRGRADWVAVYSVNLEDVAETVSLVRSRVLVGGAAALLIALLGGYIVARALARRVGRLEQAAESVTRGRFPGPLPVDSEDELGQLTHTFNEMQDQIQRVGRARQEFIANASHELRTPIFSLGGFVELLQDEDLDDATREEFLTSMAEQIERLQKLAADLLDLSRLDAGSLEVRHDNVDLSELVRAVAREFAPSLAQHETELDLELPPAAVGASCDRERVVQIMRILLDNALTHTPEGTNVTVSADRRNGAAELTVADSGPGIGDSQAEHVFERFYTGDAARGSGLGLAIAQELAERMDGKIRLHTRDGRTMFTLALPSAGPA